MNEFATNKTELYAEIRSMRSQMEGATMEAQAKLNQIAFEKYMMKRQAREQLAQGICDNIKDAISLYNDVKALLNQR